MLHLSSWLIEQMADIQIREALRDAETRRLLRQTRQVRDGWVWRQVNHVGRQLGYLLVELGVGLIERALPQPLPTTGQSSNAPCCGASL